MSASYTSRIYRSHLANWAQTTGWVGNDVTSEDMENTLLKSPMQFRMNVTSGLFSRLKHSCLCNKQ